MQRTSRGSSPWRGRTVLGEKHAHHGLACAVRTVSDLRL